MNLECSVEECPRPAHARGFCNPHYQRLHRYGDPCGGPTTTSVSCDQAYLDRLWDQDAVRRYERDGHLRRTYGISIEDYDRMLAEQGGVCAICEGPQTKKFRYFDVDHDKATGVVRGLLCRRCNTGLGYIEAGFHVAGLAYLATGRAD